MSPPKGTPKRGGRKAGTPNKITVELKTAILAAFNEAGGVEYLIERAKDNPVAFMGLLAKVLPLQVTGENGAPLTVKILRFSEEPAAA